MSGIKILKSLLGVVGGMVIFGVTSAFAANDIGSIANTVSTTFKSLGQLMAATAYLAGFALVIVAIFKFKQHKDNPQQVTIGTGIAILLVGVALIFLPNIIEPAGTSIFGTGATTGGFTGSGISAIPGAQ